MRKNGFTLIELLAVIVILAIIALIAVPIIMNIINDSKKQAALRSAENYLDAVSQAVAKENLNNEFNPSTCEVQNDGNLVCNTGNLTVKVDGEKPTSGTITFNNGKVETVTNLKYSDGYVSTDSKGNLSLSNSEIVQNEFIIPVTEDSKTTGEVPSVDSNGIFVSGSEFKIKVSDTLGYLTFFVIGEETISGKVYVNLILNKNVSTKGEATMDPQDGDEWYNASNNSYGPLTAFDYLQSSLTNTWNNIPNIIINYTDEGTNGTNVYDTIITTIGDNYITVIKDKSNNTKQYTNLKARLPKKSEMLNIGCEWTESSDNNSSCPLWAVNGLFNLNQYYTGELVEYPTTIPSSGPNQGYWLLSTSLEHSTAFAYQINFSGGITSSSTNAPVYGIRPVIQIEKTVLLGYM